MKKYKELVDTPIELNEAVSDEVVKLADSFTRMFLGDSKSLGSLQKELEAWKLKNSDHYNSHQDYLRDYTRLYNKFIKLIKSI